VDVVEKQLLIEPLVKIVLPDIIQPTTALASYVHRIPSLLNLEHVHAFLAVTELKLLKIKPSVLTASPVPILPITLSVYLALSAPSQEDLELLHVPYAHQDTNPTPPEQDVKLANQVPIPQMELNAKNVFLVKSPLPLEQRHAHLVTVVSNHHSIQPCVSLVQLDISLIAMEIVNCALQDTSVPPQPLVLVHLVRQATSLQLIEPLATLATPDNFQSMDHSVNRVSPDLLAPEQEQPRVKHAHPDTETPQTLLFAVFVVPVPLRILDKPADPVYPERYPTLEVLASNVPLVLVI
jgi:hypothetical protein